MNLLRTPGISLKIRSIIRTLLQQSTLFQQYSISQRIHLLHGMNTLLSMNLATPLSPPNYQRFPQLIRNGNVVSSKHLLTLSSRPICYSALFHHPSILLWRLCAPSPILLTVKLGLASWNCLLIPHLLAVR